MKMFTMRLALLVLPFTTLIQANLDILKTTVSYIPSSQNVEYDCVFESQWSKARHPNSFPNEDYMAHWASSVITSHDITYTMWEEGELASPAVEKLTESGGTADIIKVLQARGESYDIGYEKYIYAKDKTLRYENLQANLFKRYISAISKLAPSPDWFSGFHDFDCVNKGTNTWFQEFVLAVYPYDAGTEDGDDYDVVNNPTNPPQPITQFTVDNIPQTTKVFLNKEGTDILPVATYTCTLVDFDGGMGDTQSPIFATLTRAPTGPLLQAKESNTSLEQDKVQEKNTGDNNNGLIAGIIVGIVAVIFIVAGVFMYIFLYRKRNDENEDDDDETLTKVPSGRGKEYKKEEKLDETTEKETMDEDYV